MIFFSVEVDRETDRLLKREAKLFDVPVSALVKIIIGERLVKEGYLHLPVRKTYVK